MTTARNYKQVIAALRKLPSDICGWLEDVPSLIEDYTWDVSISYVFSRIEFVKHQTLYRGLVKRHRTDAELTWDLLDKDHMSRGRFLNLFETVFDRTIPKEINEKLSSAESIRDRIAHGKNFSDAQARQCLLDAFDFMVTFSAFVHEAAGFRPFSHGRGFKGRGQSLTKETSRWVLKGMGIPSGKEK